MDRHPSGQPSNLHKVLETRKRVSLLTFTRLQGPEWLLTEAECFAQLKLKLG